MGGSRGGDDRLTRRRLLQAGATLPALPLAATLGGPGPVAAERRRRGPQAGMHVAVVGAGAFGGWTALHLLRAGARVTLVDSWGPGNARASSGGESRVIRHTYGDARIYTEWVIRALELFRRQQQEWGVPVYEETGVLWLVHEDEGLVNPALPILEDLGVEHEVWQPDEIARRYPQLALDGVRWALFEPRAGYLRARRICELVHRSVAAGGGELRDAWARPGAVASGRMHGLQLSDGEPLHADAYVFACGPWLGQVFPDVIGERILPTRQEVYYFGLPPGDDTFAEGRFPVWADQGERLWYGIPGTDYRGFKIADDSHGPVVDPTTQERVPREEGIRAARDFIARRFPGLAGAPLVESRVCQYEVSPDGDFIIDRHPGADNVWIVGGGSGHGFKHGPALGEHVAGRVLGTVEGRPRFRLDRL